MLKKVTVFGFLILAFYGCKEDSIPKPKAKLRLEYKKPSPRIVETDYFRFEANGAAKLDQKNSKSIILEYPEMKAAIFLNYRKIENDLNRLMRDAHKLSGEHAAKADGIQQMIFDNSLNRVYGAFYEVSGDAASQAQFFATDSLNHFLTGALYFKTKPNYDSIYPAAKYLQDDMGRIMETLRWKN